jgi:hypothetical protein
VASRGATSHACHTLITLLGWWHGVDSNWSGLLTFHLLSQSQQNKNFSKVLFVPRVELLAKLALPRAKICRALALGKGSFAKRPIFDSRQSCRPSAKLLCPVVWYYNSSKGGLRICRQILITSSRSSIGPVCFIIKDLFAPFFPQIASPPSLLQVSSCHPMV